MHAHGRKLLILAALLLAGCASKSMLQPDCHSCTAEDQQWKDFSWADLGGQWRGTVETLDNERGAVKKIKQEKHVEFRFLTAENFLKAKGAGACTSLPANALVLNGLLWTNNSKKAEYEAFVPVESDKVAYGRLSFEKVNGQEVCHFRRLGPVMGQNRLALPAVTFSENGMVSGRGLASNDKDSELSVEFLRFAPSKPVPFKADGRGPAALTDAEKPALMIRVFKVSTRNVGARGQWSGSEEQLYRLWKAE